MAQPVIQQPVDVVIVGAGAAGGVFAAVLARAGKSVRILEAGPPWTRDDLVSSQIWARRLKWGGAGVVRGGDNPYGHNVIHGWGTGGAALHHYGTWPRFHPETFQLHSVYGMGHDWPVDYDTLRPWYDRVQREVGIAGDQAQEPWAAPGEPYPMPPLAGSEQGRLIAAGFKALGKPVAPLPAVINTREYNGRPACLYDGWCDAGCPIGALGNPLETYLGAARKNGVRLDNGCTVSRVLTDRKGRATGVEYVSLGQRHEQPASVIVLAGSVVQNPRLLLNSVSPRFPRGLANGNGMVGHFLDVELMTSAYGLFPQRSFPYLGVSAGALIRREKPAPVAGGKPFGGYQWKMAPAMKPNDLFGVATTRADLYGDALHQFLRRGAHHIGSMVGFGGSHTQRDNRVEIVPGQTDRDGQPLARVVNSFVPATMALLDFMRREGEAVFRAAGAAQVWSGPPGTGHTVGGTIMGSAPASSVTDSFGRCHEVENLFLAGGGIIPGSGGTSPTFTIHALSLRAAEHLGEHWAQYAQV